MPLPDENNQDDFLLIQRLRQNDAAAYMELYNRYHVKMYSWLIRFVKLPELAEDIIQETFLKIWEIRHRLQPHQSFPAYLYRISRNRAFRLLKKIAHDEKQPPCSCLQADIFAEAVLSSSSNSLLVRRCKG